MGSSIVFIDGTVVSVILPALQTNLNATVVDMKLLDDLLSGGGRAVINASML
ncbi:MAG: hypothetical protein WCB68_02015 [Pyrinomonadaceae bacterium]